MTILVLNSGSSSQKSCLYELEGPLPQAPPAPLWEAELDWGMTEGGIELSAKNNRGAVLEESLNSDSRAAAIRRMLATIWDGPAKAVERPSAIDRVGHRVVHGGDYRQPAFVTPEVKAAISRFSAFAPLHNAADLEGIEVVEQMLGNVPQIAVFDTAFHSGLPLPAAVYPGPYAWYQRGIRRYGFHGISHQYCAERAAELLGRSLESLQLVTCHLGSGCSLAAIRNGHSVDTTMGFTPLEGLMMGTRSGTVDPGILTYLLRQGIYTPEGLDGVLNRESGLLGISGVSSDLREVAAAGKRGEPRAKLALDIFVHRVRRDIGAMLPSLGRLDALVFTAGIGENSPAVRAAVCEPLGFLGIELDAENNTHSLADQDVAAAGSAVRVLVIHTREEWAIARECWRLGPLSRHAN